MKAIFLKKYGNSDRAFEIRETEKPKISPGNVLIKVKVSGLNFADVIARRGLYPDAPKNPAILGYDVAGYIEEIGSEVTDFEVGQKVTALSRFGGYAEYVSTMKEAVAVLPDDYDLELATALSTQGCTAFYCAEEMVQIHENDTVLVQAAAGGVGIILCQLAKHKKAKIIGTASTKKQDFMRRNGVHYPIDYTKEDIANYFEKNNLTGIDIAFDSIGGKSFKNLMKLLHPGGRMVSFGAASQIQANKTNKLKTIGVALGFGLFSPIQLLMKSQAIIGVNMLRIADHRPHIFKYCLDQVVQYAEQGIIKPVLAKSYAVEKIAEAHDFLESRNSIGKVNLIWD